jgi:hypothetical protein
MTHPEQRTQVTHPEQHTQVAHPEQHTQVMHPRRKKKAGVYGAGPSSLWVNYQHPPLDHSINN